MMLIPCMEDILSVDISEDVAFLLIVEKEVRLAMPDSVAGSI